MGQDRFLKKDRDLANLDRFRSWYRAGRECKLI